MLAKKDDVQKNMPAIKMLVSKYAGSKKMPKKIMPAKGDASQKSILAKKDAGQKRCS